MSLTAPQHRLDLADMLVRARKASRVLPTADRANGLLALADALEERAEEIVRANAPDVEAEVQRGTPTSRVDRLRLGEDRVTAIAASVRQIAELPDPLHRVLEGWRLPNGLEVRKQTVPFGVIGMIYESRPNVTVDAAALALKAGSAAVLRGSSNALGSNRTLVAIMREALVEANLPADAIQLVDSADRGYVTELLAARGRIDLVIPRGGPELISHVVETAKVPTIETGVGNCHVYVDGSANLAKARDIVLNAKLQRPGVCNAAETLLVANPVAEEFLPPMLEELAAAGVELVGCPRARRLSSQLGVAEEEDWAQEYLDLKLAVKVVDGLDDAIDHIDRYGTQHSETIVAQDRAAARRFQSEVDAAAVLVNASARFVDGFEFGFGAEIGISTQKLHARGPMGLEQIVTYKYLVEGDGQVRA